MRVKGTFGCQKTPRVALNTEEYLKLCQEVLKRDDWRCQNCGVMRRLQIHHKQFRSHGGDDTKENLITLCGGCHTQLHVPRLRNNGISSKKSGEK